MLPVQRRKIHEARAELRKLGKPDTAGRIVAALSLGFWVHLFDRPYERAPYMSPRLSWHDDNLALLHMVFPHAPRRFRSREAMRRQCEEIREVRNRIFHYEPIWHRTDLGRQHAATLNVIGWISPQMRFMVGLCDRFTLIYQGGRQSIEERLQLHLSLEESG